LIRSVSQDIVNTNYELVEHLRKIGVLKSPRLVRAFLKVDRKDFVLSECKDAAYEDAPLPIGFAQTISQPYTVAFMLELLDLRWGDRVLDLGSGSGWTTALLAKTVGTKGYVLGIERHPDLVRLGRKNLRKYVPAKARISRSLKTGIGYPGKTFDRILVSASGDELNSDLLLQLKDNGKMVLPVKNSLVLVEKRNGNITLQKFGDFSFVPLIVEETLKN
jgi:protein-L-isoaspartate(D-aspartate) O-methyltransferase